jgi:hypothetical protein
MRLFRDELYHLACSDHLDWGSSISALSIAILKLTRVLAGVRSCQLFAGVGRRRDRCDHRPDGALARRRPICAGAGALSIIARRARRRARSSRRFRCSSGHLARSCFCASSGGPSRLWLLGVIVGLGLMNVLNRLL